MVLRVAVRPPVASRDRVVHRPRGWCTLGRETSIQKVEWAEDGWPYIVGGHGGERYVEAPKDAIETVAPASRDQHDEFDADVLGLDWNTLRVPFDEKMGSVGGGSLKLIGQGSLCNTFDLSLVARRWQAFDFDAETCVAFDPKTYQAMAGLRTTTTTSIGRGRLSRTTRTASAA